MPALDWLATQPARTIVGLDVNSPRFDHPDVENVYWGDEYGFDYQCERLLFDPKRAPHRRPMLTAACSANALTKLLAYSKAGPPMALWLSPTSTLDANDATTSC
jgi:hypothetical protein